MIPFDFTPIGFLIYLFSDFEIPFWQSWLLVVLTLFIPLVILISDFMWSWSFSDALSNGIWVDKTLVGKYYIHINTKNKFKRTLSKDLDMDNVKNIGFGIWASIIFTAIFQLLFMFFVFFIYTILKLPFMFSFIILGIIFVGIVIPFIIYVFRAGIRKRRSFQNILSSDAEVK